MILQILEIFLITLIPTLELRASIPYGILVLGISAFWVFVISVLSNIILIFIVWIFVNHFMIYFLKIRFVNRIYKKLVIRTQKKFMPYVEKYGVIGLALFIGIPLPGSGVYTGGLGAYLLGYKFKDYLKAATIGVLIAGIIVTIIVVSGVNGVNFMYKSF